MTDKELTIQLSCAALQAMAQMRTNPAKPLTGNDILNIVKECESIVHSLDSSTANDGI